MELLYGVGLVAVMGAMIWFGRPPEGQNMAPWLRVYIVGQAYVMTAMVCGVIGVTLVIQNWS